MCVINFIIFFLIQFFQLKSAVQLVIFKEIRQIKISRIVIIFGPVKTFIIVGYTDPLVIIRSFNRGQACYYIWQMSSIIVIIY